MSGGRIRDETEKKGGKQPDVEPIHFVYHAPKSPDRFLIYRPNKARYLRLLVDTTAVMCSRAMFDQVMDMMDGAFAYRRKNKPRRASYSRFPYSKFGIRIFPTSAHRGEKTKGEIGAQSEYLGRKVDRICTFPCIYPYRNKVVQKGDCTVSTK